MGTQVKLPIQENVPEIPPWGTDLFSTKKLPIQKKDSMENPTYVRHLFVKATLSDLRFETPICFTNGSTDTERKQLALGYGPSKTHRRKMETGKNMFVNDNRTAYHHHSVSTFNLTTSKQQS
ncbi:hypothetical protein GHT06_022558 [Daphnia sinensis]|uniref:Uncharacterized protein n=1 Tax=Daphnia sinensis TaxID=1820382 RepID=A0AAD5KYW5_9CRUS|nr:hypothetical protein GHT06_022558 [Daphnia sinensis]